MAVRSSGGAMRGGGWCGPRLKGGCGRGSGGGCGRGTARVGRRRGGDRILVLRRRQDLEVRLLTASVKENGQQILSGVDLTIREGENYILGAELYSWCRILKEEKNLAGRVGHGFNHFAQ